MLERVPQDALVGADQHLGGVGIGERAPQAVTTFALQRDTRQILDDQPLDGIGAAHRGREPDKAVVVGEHVPGDLAEGLRDRRLAGPGIAGEDQDAGGA